jgi:hypothetical protein
MPILEGKEIYYSRRKETYFRRKRKHLGAWLAKRPCLEEKRPIIQLYREK